MPIAWAELPAPVQQLVYEGLGVMGVLALNREWRACRERRVAERLPCDTHNVPSSLPGGIVLRLLPNYAIEPEVGRWFLASCGVLTTRVWAFSLQNHDCSISKPH